MSMRVNTLKGKLPNSREAGSKAPDVSNRCQSCSNSISSCGFYWKIRVVISVFCAFCLWIWEYFFVSLDCLELLPWSLPVHESKFYCMFVLKCVSQLFCMGVCFSCGPSNGHKAGSVCPLGCWNVHFGQQAASVLNRSCLSYCTSCTMSFSLSVSLSLFPCLSLFMTIYRQCFWWETGGVGSWSVFDIPVTASLCRALSQYITISRDVRIEQKSGLWQVSFHLCGSRWA